MRILFYPPFKPLDHADPSGDLTIASGLYHYLEARGHWMYRASPLRSRWIFWKPWMWPYILRERHRAIMQIPGIQPDLWLTYHTYYKAPDLLGYSVCHRANLPYVIFQAMFSTKRRRNLRTLPGYLLNKKALCAARHIFINRKEDLINLERLLPRKRLTYIAPGINPRDFSFNARDRVELHRSWGVRDEPVVLSAAMFRPGVKASGISWVIRACGDLIRRGNDLFLAIAGDGRERPDLERLAAQELPGKVRFVGKVPREQMHRFYSAGDIFAFPGFRESLGMVFLEAQSCGLPVVACANGGIPEVVQEGITGFLVPLSGFDAFVQAMGRLLNERGLRQAMGGAARTYIRDSHDLEKNYQEVERILGGIGGTGDPRIPE
jgi:glycosyltransferase involved in cell wall biosynthesis